MYSIGCNRLCGHEALTECTRRGERGEEKEGKKTRLRDRKGSQRTATSSTQSPISQPAPRAVTGGQSPAAPSLSCGTT
ncbi:hypothetical protein PR002_g2811 [Phytophthora rubi]|uniref:Uncharacterized protein n=1 Tax=Phytophthora rubi TaxID=129364 RepID=A0A6A3NLL6_9STRA|nr:hypothetical protein PR002_g2811 [Phytophthora rubi]